MNEALTDLEATSPEELIVRVLLPDTLDVCEDVTDRVPSSVVVCDGVGVCVFDDALTPPPRR